MEFLNIEFSTDTYTQSRQWEYLARMWDTFGDLDILCLKNVLFVDYLPFVPMKHIFIQTRDTILLTNHLPVHIEHSLEVCVTWFENCKFVISSSLPKDQVEYVLFHLNDNLPTIILAPYVPSPSFEVFLNDQGHSSKVSYMNIQTKHYAPVKWNLGLTEPKLVSFQQVDYYNDL